MSEATEVRVDSFADMQKSALDPAAAGRGATSGFVQCALCPPSSRKRFARGRGYQTHLQVIHRPHYAAAEWAALERRLVARADAQADIPAGHTRTGAKAVRAACWLFAY